MPVKGSKGAFVPPKYDGLSQEECAQRLGISRERVSQLERRAMKKMQALVLSTDEFPLLRHERET